MGRWWYLFTIIATMSVPPVEPLLRNTIPKKQPMKSPPKITAINGSVIIGTSGIGITFIHNVSQKIPNSVRAQ